MPRKPVKTTVKPKKKVNQCTKVVKKRVFDETIEVLDSDDDFVIPNPSVRGKIQKEKICNDSYIVELKEVEDLENFNNIQNDDTSTAEDDVDIEILEDVKTVSTKVIEVLDCDDDEVSDNFYGQDYDLNSTKDAWKGLMQRMQQNQKHAPNNNLTSSTFLKPSKTAKKGSKKPVVTLPKGPRTKVDSTFLSNNKTTGLTNSSSTSNSTRVDWPIPQKASDKIPSGSPPKKLKLEMNTEENQPSTSSSSSTGSSPAKSCCGMNKTAADAKIPLMFLKPEEKAAVLLAEKLEKAKIQSNPNLVLSVLSEPHTFSSVNETPDQFDGNIVLANDYDPGVDPYAGQKKKVCPFYKKLPGTNFSVDAFNYGLIEGIDFYFLSHFHSDHYIGLTKKFCKTLICSPPTANLVKMKLYVEDKCVRRLQLNKPYVIQGVEVILIDANHCPGSVMFIFRLPNGITYLHTGDFRFTTDMLDNHFLQGLKIDNLYLDTTYCDPKYDFPTQVESIVELIAAVKRKLEYRPKTLIVCGSYVIGKERVYFSLAEALHLKVFAEKEKRRVIRALENPRFSSYLSDNEDSADIHVAQMFSIVPKILSEYLSTRSAKYTNIIGIKPSGWQFSFAGSGTSIRSHYNDTVTVIGVPYSEHSSFSELQQFVCATKPRKVQPTVNVGSEPKRTAMMAHINKWMQS